MTKNSRKKENYGLGYVPVPISQSGYMPLTPTKVSTALPVSTPVGYKPKISGNAIGNALNDIVDFFTPEQPKQPTPVPLYNQPQVYHKPKTPHKDNTMTYVAIGGSVLVLGTIIAILAR